MARRNRILPLLKVATDLIIVVDDPLKQDVFEDVEKLTGLNVSICLGNTSEIESALDKVYGAKEEGVVTESELQPLSERFSKPEIAPIEQDKTGAALLDRLLKEVYSSGAEALHIDRIGAETLVRARIGGRLEAWFKLAGDVGAALSTRVRVLGGIGAVKEEGISGEFEREVEGKSRKFQVTVLPASNGESILLRPHKEAITIPPLKDLGFTRSQLKQVRAFATLHRGLIVTTGPRSSGKTTTLYSIFGESDPTAEKLVTIEDEPVGIKDLGIALHMTDSTKLSALLEAALSADPDSILIQPVPTQDVLERAIHEALQGIKVGIQLPFADSIAALSFLLSGSAPSQAVAGAISGVIAQRILRTLCDKCKKPDKLLPGLKTKDAKPCRPEGCEACKGTGYAGRVAIFEVVAPDSEFRILLGSKPDAAAIRTALANTELVTLRDRALELYSEGLTSAEEIAEFI
jgi:type II secretory ATPase GspE/PulE/Tfp pilus assembly ATPase PilB-like protein